MSMQILDTDLIRTFVTVCEAGSFRRAADRIHRTPSAVSMQMARLEETLGAPLFRKDGRSIKISTKGEELLAYARRILSLSEEAVSRFRSPCLTGRVRLGVPDDYETRLLPPVLSRFAKMCPDVEVELVLGVSQALVQMVERGDLDVAIGSAPYMVPGPVTSELLHAEPLVWLGRAGGTAKLRRPLPLAVPGDVLLLAQHGAGRAGEGRNRLSHRVLMRTFARADGRGAGGPRRLAAAGELPHAGAGADRS